MQVFLKVLLFFMLLRNGACLQCETCMKIFRNHTGNATSINCSGPMKTCAANKNTCSVVYSRHNLDGVTEHSIERSCDYSSICTRHKLHFSVGMGRGYRSSIICCNGKNCPKDIPPLSPEKKTPNGKECPACFAWSDKCKPKTMKCTGSDTHCLEIKTTRIQRPNGKTVNSVMKGCTSEAVCVSLKEDKTPLFTGEVDEVACTPKVSKGSQPTSFFLPTVFGLLLMKIFG
ncbi:phospholipase A2 inhibitor gamma subunit B isoform X2 [Anolis carolinensis]|nr:PREDICTED: phospholipase A2 inhibitor subunit gamma B [Anolis carolinensis]XP_008111983.1 PREDICTED: phospholipase A2 inhibitor subunit gamma B [Anolis carolinensis]XP_016850265.1 PREDICTED: phospholipase A2 inhibitor subunit gamma B [Anolis carolinensis]|eukprot:XP_003222861.1 PREDICTED: phospholipase A2 inhibitor subunit gamma B [Anolis carolinensis]